MYQLSTNNKKNLALITQLILGCIMLYGCSSSGNSGGTSGGNNNGNGDVSSLQMIAPKTAYSKTAESANTYIVVNNPSESTVSNIHYSLINQIGGAIGSSIDNASATNCAIVAAHSQCNVKVSIPAGAIAGSFGISADNKSNTQSKTSQATNVISLLTIGVEQSAYNNLSGADGITLSYYHTVINGTPYILVSGLIASVNTGNFNDVVLVDSSNNPLPNQQLITETGNFSQGTTFNILLPVPSANGLTQTIKAQTQMVAKGKVTVVSTATNSSTLTTVKDVGIAEMLPSAVYLTPANPEQIITFSNIGSAIAQLQGLVSNNPNVGIVFNPTNLDSGSTAMATLRLKNTSVATTTGNVILTYNNGQSETTTSGIVDQNVNPTPTPTPTPSPSPVLTPRAGLTTVFSPDNDFFTTTATGTVSKQMTITNIGNTTENGLVLTLPTNFTISSGINNSCTVTSGTSPATISDSLPASTGNCNITVSYNNNTKTNENSGNISISYNYNNGTPAPTPTETTVNYRVTQSTAILSLTTPLDPYNFINISGVSGTDFATQTFTLYNSGEIDATNVVGSINPTSIFSILSNYSSTIAAGTNGNLNLQFGPSSSFGSYNTTLTVNYDDYPTHAATPVTIAITGSVSNAIAYLKTIGAIGFAGGNGQTAATAYALQTGSNGQVTLTYENKGNENAQNFRSTTGTISSKLTGTPFTLVTDGCNLDNGGKTLTPNETCDEVLQYTPTTAGATTLPLNTTNWQFSYSDTHGNYTYNSAPVYFNAYAPATIAITTSGLTAGESVAIASSFNIVANLTGGYNIANQTIALQNLSPSDAGIDVSGTCTVNSSQPTCTIPVDIGVSTAIQNYTVEAVNQTAGVSISSGTPVAFNVYDPTPVGSETILGAAAEVGCLILKSNHQPYCWGNNHQGELGIGSFTSQNTPTAVLMGGSSAIPVGTLFSQISVAVAGDYYGDSSVCAISSSNQVYCWGYNGYGELGNGTTTTSNVAVAVIAGQIPTGVKLTKVSNAGDHVCGVGTDGKAYCWGRNTSGQLGNGSTTSSSSPVLVLQGQIPSGITIRDIGAGVRGTCAIASNGKAYCWGNYYSSSSSNTPVLLNGGALPSNYQTIAISLAHDDVGQAACLIADTGSMYCWGSNGSGQLGNGSTTSSSSPVLVSQGQVTLGAKWLSVSQGGNSTCGMTDQGLVYCWGNNYYGQLGLGNTTTVNTPQAIAVGGSSQIPSGTKLIAISGGYDDDGGANAMFCGMSDLGNVYCWGSNTYGQLGYGVTGGTSSYAKAVAMP